MNKITIIGAGKVGSTIAYTLSVMNLAKDIVMIDINHELALGEALDIRQGTPFSSNCSVYAGDYPDAANSNIVVITSGVARKPGQSRLELAQTNVNIMKSIMPQVTKYAPDAMYIIVSNPVDILTYQWCKRSGLPENHIIGSGTILDTARLKARLSEYYNISQSNVHAYVFGEHGETSFIPWSIAQVSTIKLLEYKDLIKLRTGILTDLDFDEKRKIMCDLLSRAQRPVVTCHAAGRAPGANGGSCIGRLPHPEQPVRKQCEQQVSACCSHTISGFSATGIRICSSGTSSSAPSAYRLSTVGRVSPFCHL